MRLAVSTQVPGQGVRALVADCSLHSRANLRPLCFAAHLIKPGLQNGVHRLPFVGLLREADAAQAKTADPCCRGADLSDGGMWQLIVSEDGGLKEYFLVPRARPYKLGRDASCKVVAFRAAV